MATTYEQILWLVVNDDDCLEENYQARSQDFLWGGGGGGVRTSITGTK